MYKRVMIALCALAISLMSLGIAVAGDQYGPDAQGTRLRTTLAGPAIQGVKPHGNADFRIDGARLGLTVQVESVNLPDGTKLTVAVIHSGAAVKAGTLTLLGGFGQLELRTQDGETVPQVQAGDFVVVMQGTTKRLAGVF